MMRRIIQTQTDDGLCLNGLFADAPGQETVIVHVHGMEGNFYNGAEPYFAGYERNGIAYMAGKNRGSDIAKRFALVGGGERVIGGAYEVFEDCLQDIKAWIDYAEAQGYSNVWLSSHSLRTGKSSVLHE